MNGIVSYDPNYLLKNGTIHGAWSNYNVNSNIKDLMQ